MDLFFFRGIIFPCFALVSCCRAPLCDKSLVSFYRGHLLWKEQLHTAQTPYELEDVLEGIRAGQRGDPLPLPEKELATLAKRFEEHEAKKQLQKNLAEAEGFLRHIKEDPRVVEVVPLKLYYKQEKRGEGRKIEEQDVPLVLYSVKTVFHGKEEVLFFAGTQAIALSLPDTIPGFFRGVLGMHVGEVRTLYIHPDFAYGASGRGVGPNQLLIIDVEIIGFADTQES